MHDELTGQIETLIMPYINELSAELVELKVRHQNKMTVIEIIADRPGGITIAECAFINKKVNHQLEKKQWFGENYVVEVSSPGLDRKLKTTKDFLRVLGKKVRFHLSEAIEGKVEHSGEILKVKNDETLIKTKDKTITIPLKAISKAVQVIQ